MSESNVKNGNDISLKMTDPKDFLAKYKENELRNSAQTVGMTELNSRISPRLHSPNSSEGSLGRTVTSPYSSLLEGARVPTFNPYLPNSNLVPNDFQNEINNLANRFTPNVLNPLTPISPLLSLNSVSRFFLSNNGLFSRGICNMPNLPNDTFLHQASRALPHQTTSFNKVLKPVSQDSIPSLEDATNGIVYADLPEQEKPIDLSSKRKCTLNESYSLNYTRVEDQDSDFSPSSNEENRSTPLDLTAKRRRFARFNSKSLSIVQQKQVKSNNNNNTESQTEDDDDSSEGQRLGVSDDSSS